MHELLENLKYIVGAGAWETDARVLEPNLTEWRGTVHGKTAIMVSPATCEQVADVVRACARAGTGIVPQGGNTGMCAGAVPDDSGQQVLLNVSKLNRIRSVDASDYSLVAEAGCVLADVQAAAAAVKRYFPLSMGGEGSCQIGGNISTNAGGINVLRYGTTRNLVLGIEAVLADGTIWNGLKTLRKDTAGYDLKQLFIGSEGTLGIVTAAALKLYPAPGETACALIPINDAAAAVDLLSFLREQLADRILAFELIGERSFEYVLRHIPGTKLPFDSGTPWYVLTEVALAGADQGLENALAGAAGRGLIADAAIAKNAAESAAFWRMRHSIAEAEKREGDFVKHDVSVPIGKLREFLAQCDRRLARAVPGALPVAFGHVGDGNLHYNVRLPAGAPDTKQLRAAISAVVYDLVTELGGSISAEHGIGTLKKQHLYKYKSEVEIRLMRTLKAALDPDNILNPGKVI